MNEKEIKKAIERIEYINHSGSGRLHGISVEAVNIRSGKESVSADVIIRGPTEGSVRKYEGLEYEYDYLSQFVDHGED